jgi:hypothetical protein
MQQKRQDILPFSRRQLHLRIEVQTKASHTIIKPFTAVNTNLLLVTSDTIPLLNSPGISRSTQFVKLLLDLNATSAIFNYRDAAHLVPITIGNQTFDVILDTGSADTWVISSTFKCTNSQD